MISYSMADAIEKESKCAHISYSIEGVYEFAEVQSHDEYVLSLYPVWVRKGI